MADDVVRVWKAGKHLCYRRAMLSWSVATGCAEYVPHDMGEAIYAIVKDHYTRALAVVKKHWREESALRKMRVAARRRGASRDSVYAILEAWREESARSAARPRQP